LVGYEVEVLGAVCPLVPIKRLRAGCGLRESHCVIMMACKTVGTSGCIESTERKPMSHTHLEELAVFLLRYGLIFARPAFHHFFHKAAEHQIHNAVHKVGVLGLLTKWCKFVPDAVMIAILVLLDIAMESFGTVGHKE
jgi:hypothetical protein